MQLFEWIRRDREREGLSIRGLAERYGVHRRAVRQALAAALPPERKRPAGRPASKLVPYRELIDSWLIADRGAPSKQRHTAKRVWERLCEEHGVDVSVRTVAYWVAARRRELSPRGLGMVPLVHDPGVEAEVDWGEAQVVLAGQATKVHLFHMRACHSGAAFVMAFGRETQQAFLEGHVHAFDWFGGVFQLVRYDNLSSAVKRVLKGRRRVETDRFIALRSHYMFDSQFTLVGLGGAHEKGGVEGEVGRFRRRHLVPVPEVQALGELNARIIAGCERDLDRRITGRKTTVNEALVAERRLLRCLPSEVFDGREVSTHRVDSKALVTIRQNRYSVPVALIGRKVIAKIGAREVEIFCDGRCAALHERLAGRFEVRACLDHYLELLATKPGALRNSLPLRQQRELGKWPACLDELWTAIENRYGASQAAKQMVDVLLLSREFSPLRVQQAVHEALRAGAHDGRAVAVLASQSDRQQPTAIQLDNDLVAVKLPQPSLTHYNQLLTQGANQ